MIIQKPETSQNRTFKCPGIKLVLSSKYWTSWPSFFFFFFFFHSQVSLFLCIFGQFFEQPFKIWTTESSTVDILSWWHLNRSLPLINPLLLVHYKNLANLLNILSLYAGDSVQWGSEIGSSMDFEWSKRGWVASGLVFEWNLKSGSPTMLNTIFCKCMC